MSLASNLKRANIKPKPHRQGPVWKGPEEDGVTQSLLGRFLVCRERFRLLVVEGLRAAETFYPPIEYGNMWHVCEEALASSTPGHWGQRLTNYCRDLARKYPHQQDKVDHWYKLCKAQFPVYVDYWAKHPDVTGRTPLLQEQQFDVPYKLPSGRTVRLRGKWDAVDLVTEKTKTANGFTKRTGVWLQENKTKSKVDVPALTRQLSFDLQTMFYLVALDRWFPEFCSTDHGLAGAKPPPIRGVRYNVIRRSQHKSVESFMTKLTEDLRSGRAGEWFARFNVEVTAGDVARFRRECLDPILEDLCDWWCLLMVDPFDPWTPRVNMSSDGGKTHQLAKFYKFDPAYPVNAANNWHWRHPFGVYNVLDEGGSTDLDGYLATGSEVGLERTDNLFPELV